MADTTTTVFYSFGIISIILLIFVSIYLLFINFSKVINLVKYIFEYPFDIVYDLFKNNESIIDSNNCALYQSTNTIISRVPSIYIAHIAFFFGFLFTNAYIVYNLTSQDNSDQTKVDTRKSRALMTMIVLTLVYIAIVLIRYNITGCESLLGVLFSTSAFGTLGYLSYIFAEYCGARNADILGIASSIYDNNPVVCSTT